MKSKIKSQQPRKNSRYSQGYFDINECVKYKGHPPIIYRSSWEKKFCLYCERDDKIAWWSSESISIPYFNPLTQKTHEYFPDFIVELIDGTKWIVEVKPKHQTLKPKLPKRKTPKTVASYKNAVNTYVVNTAKFKAAIEFAKSRNAKFILITEDFFKPTFK